jgi:glycosyltransferase involved in cell wall biosynthesis
MKNFVSIIVPCYNQAQYLDEALQSVLVQSYSSWECIIVNDGSPDNTEQIANQWCEKDTRFRYVFQQNAGLSAARNCGIKLSKSKYVVTLDADDKYESTFISKAVEILENNLDVGVVSSWGYRFMGNDYFEPFKPNGKNLKDFLFQNAAIGTSLFRKKCWIEVGGYDENMKNGYEDWEFYIRVGKMGWETKIIEEFLFFYRQRKNSMRNIAVKDHDAEIKHYIFQKHKELYIENFEGLTQNLLSIASNNKKNELKRINSIDFRLGHFILKPFRFLKNIFKK